MRILQAEVFRRISDPYPAGSQALYPNADSAGSGIKKSRIRIQLYHEICIRMWILVDSGIDESRIQIQSYQEFCIRMRFLQAQV